MAPNVQAGGNALLVEAAVDATALVGANALLVEAAVDATARVGGVALLVEAIPLLGVTRLAMHYKRLRTQ